MNLSRRGLAARHLPSSCPSPCRLSFPPPTSPSVRGSQACHLQRWAARSTPPDQQSPGGPEKKEPEKPSAATSTSSLDGQSPLALEGEKKDLQISREVIERLKTTVFGFDTFFVTSVDNYKQDGVVFRGNVRGKDPLTSYLKIRDRMRAQLGDDYQLFMLEDLEGQPTVAILPKNSVSEGSISRATEIILGIAFTLFTIVSTANANNIPLFQFLLYPYQTLITAQEFEDAMVPALTFFAILIAHELGHWVAAKRQDVKLYFPLFIPAGFGFIGSFGAITRFRGFATSRAALLDIANAGPLAGTALAAAATLVGFILSASGITDVTIDSPSFQDSFIMAVAADAFLGDALANPEIQVNSLMVAGWAGLVVNALNVIPVGELDGGRISLAIFGRKTYRALGIATLGVLAVTSLGSSLSFYWFGLILFLQRGPSLPCYEELSEPKDEAAITTGLALLGLPFLVLAPYPTELMAAVNELGKASF